MSTEATPGRSSVDSALLGRGLAALRIFVGLIAFSNGLAKLFLILALVPAGLVWGLDGRLGRNHDRVRWPS